MTDTTNHCPICEHRERVVEDLVEACKASLYLLGNDSDRKVIGDKPWGKARDATRIPYMLRAAIAKWEGREPQKEKP